jgi:protein-S-isoprenylcysteine O-methyltransferase Ste14
VIVRLSGRLHCAPVSARALRGLIALLAFDGVAIVCLYPRIDVFACGYLLGSNMLAVMQVVMVRRLGHSPDLIRLFAARDIDTLFDRVVPVLGLAEIAVFLQYARRAPDAGFLPLTIQASGLVLCCGSVLWLAWVDRFLAVHFAAHDARNAPMTTGPYRLVRHPRYVGLVASRLALPLIFRGSVSWIVTAAWAVMICRRARLEERYLTGRFGASYTNYLQRSWHFWPAAR